MSYYIKSLPDKKSDPKWKIQYVSFKKADAPNSKAKEPRRTWDISKKRWQSLGFNEFLYLEEAKARAKQLNAQLHLKRQEERLKKMEDERFQLQKRHDAVLPYEFVAEFEERFIRKSVRQTEEGFRRSASAYKKWQAAQRMIVAIGTDPSEWFYDTYKIYDYFYHQKMSVSYISSILRMANLWGFFFCRKLARPFLPISSPRGYERLRLIEAHYEKQKNVCRPSKPLFLEDLYKVKGSLNKKNFNWLFISIWFGLRPQEIDNLKDKNFWKIEILPSGRKILWVLQTKIIAVPFEDRWKPIPLLFDEQFFALKIIESGNFKRPLVKTMRKHFDQGVTLYGGRKGFTDFMLSKGQSLENISIWMGHSTLSRTWRSYKNRRQFHLAGF